MPLGSNHLGQAYLGQGFAGLLGPTVTFHANDGSGSVGYETSGVPVPLTANSFTRAGYTFSNWNTATDGSGTSYANGVTYSFATNLTLYAQWTANPTDTVTFNPQGGSAVGSMSGLDGTTITLPAAPTYPGYTFAGWFAAASGGTALTSPYTLAGSVTLYAQWTANPTVQVAFDVQGGSYVASLSALMLSYVALPSAPAFLGRKFLGWFALPIGGTALTSPYLVSGPTELFAQWSGAPVKIRKKTTLEVWTGPTATTSPAFVRDITDHVTACTWSEDETQSPRRTCSVTIESQGYPVDGLVPQSNGDLLHPLTGNELRIFHGWVYSDGSEDLSACGVYRMSKPHTVNNGQKVEITIAGNDRAAEVSKRSWTVPYVISGSPSVDQAVHDLIDSRLPGLTYNLEPIAFTVPDITFGTQGMTSPVDPMADAIKVAQSAGAEVFFDDNGVVRLRTVIDPMTAAVVREYLDGSGVELFQTDQVIDETQTFNGVVCVSSAAGPATPVRETVWVTDPTSPLNPATFGEVPYFFTSPLVTTSAQAIAAATGKLQTLLTAFDDVAFTAVPDADLHCGDAVRVQSARARIDDTYVVSQISMTSDVTQLMTVTCRARRTAA